MGGDWLDISLGIVKAIAFRIALYSAAVGAAIWLAEVISK